MSNQVHIMVKVPPRAKRLMGEYRMLMVEEGAAAEQEDQGVPGESKTIRRKKRNGFSPIEIGKVLESGGKLRATQMLHCKVRYFTDEVVLGGRNFVDKFFHRMKEARPEQHTKRTTGARKLRKIRDFNLYSLRDLRKDVYRV